MTKRFFKIITCKSAQFLREKNIFLILPLALFFSLSQAFAQNSKTTTDIYAPIAQLPKVQLDKITSRSWCAPQNYKQEIFTAPLKTFMLCPWERLQRQKKFILQAQAEQQKEITAKGKSFCTRIPLCKKISFGMGNK